MNKAKTIINFKCELCGKDISLPYNYKLRNFQKYGKDLCRSCRQHLQYENGLRDKNLLKNSVKPQKNISMKERCKWSDEEYAVFKQKLSKASSGINNPMYGEYTHTKGLKERGKFIKGKTWEQLYGEEKASIIKEKLHKAKVGKNNPMYGKPAPCGSGNGWSGWYKNFYFRSLLELSFLVANPDVKSAEYLKIPYIDWQGNERTYHPDFIKDNILYEIKPFHLISSKENQLKFAAAREYCNKNQLIYKIVTENEIKKLSNEEIDRMYKQQKLKFIERYEEKYKNYKRGSK